MRARKGTKMQQQIILNSRKYIILTRKSYEANQDIIFINCLYEKKRTYLI